MQLINVDTEHAYNQIREMIITLELAPGALVNEQELAGKLDLGMRPIREALKLLVHDRLIEISKHQGLYVSNIKLEDLKLLSEVRVLMEGYTARLAAERATEDDVVVLEALVDEQKNISLDDTKAWFDIDHKLHQAIANAAHNHYLEGALEYYFGLSQRLWYFALPKIDFLSNAVQEHGDLLTSIKKHDLDRAENIMVSHVQSFYNKIYEILNENSN